MTQTKVPLDELINIANDVADPIKQQRVVTELGSRPVDELSADEAMLLARSYLNLKLFHKAMLVLFAHPLPESPVWHYRVGLAFYGVDLYVQARSAFRTALTLTTVLEGQDFRRECEVLLEDVLARLRVPVLKTSFKKKAARVWEDFEKNEALLWKAFGENDLDTLIDKIGECFAPLGQPVFEVAEVFINGTERRAQVSVSVDDHDLTALVFLRLFELAPEALSEHWVFRVGTPQHSHIDALFERFPLAASLPDGRIQLLMAEPERLPQGAKVYPTNAFSLDLSGEKRQSAKIITAGPLPTIVQKMLLGEARMTCLNITWEVAREPMVHTMKIDGVIEGLKRYYSERVWDFYAAYTEANLPVYEFEMVYGTPEDPRRLISHQACRLVDLYGEYERMDDVLAAECEQMGTMPVSLVFDGPWENPQDAVVYMEGLVKEAFGEDWLRLGWGVGGVFMMDILLTDTKFQAYEKLFEAVRRDPKVSMCLFNPILKGVEPVIVKVDKAWTEAHPGVLETERSIN